jgi:malate dehydrogenase (oxaloacetate-decarboxylating)(NADP+)
MTTESKLTSGVPTDRHTAILRGVDLLHDPELNKGTAFTEEERDALGLRGLLPTRVHQQEEQVVRVLQNMREMPTPLQKYVAMISLMDRNETLFYRVVMDHLDEMMPIIYTPTVGKACQLYGHIFRRPRGLFVSVDDRGKIRDVLKNWSHRDVRVIVVTDGERILGLGDLGVNGMGIPVGKLSLYTACAGIHPSQCLPVTLDVGTNREELLNDPLYIGLRRRRLTGSDYDDLVDEFVEAVQETYPKAVIQFEDFANRNAFRLLERYRHRSRAFNDDIQGTASVVLAGVLTALRITERKLEDQKFLFMGAGSASIGCGDLLVSAMQDCGLSAEEARAHCWFIDSRGLVEDSRTDLATQKQRYAHKHEPVKDLGAAVEMLKPTALIGASGQPGVFTQPIIEAMARINPRPIIFSLSNPTSMSECSAEQAYTWSEGRAVFASGSPFDPVTIDGKRLVPGQGNNAYIFPGVGLGVVISGARHVTDEMFTAAARALVSEVSEEDLASGSIYPPLTHVRKVSAVIAEAVAEIAYERGLATEPRPENLAETVAVTMYQPVYRQHA